MTKTETSGESILEQILHEARDFGLQGRRLLAAFDLDSTLFDLTLRVASIVDSYACDPQNQMRFPQECEALKRIQIWRTDWGIGEALARIGLKEEGAPEFFKELHNHWADCFFSDHYLHFDEPLSGAVEFVQELRRLGADIMYLTGRDVPRMHKGTVASLEAHKFPLEAPRCRLVMKPSAQLDDAAFKLTILRDCERTYEKIWLFENEPVNLNLIAKHCPSIGLVFIDSTHSGKEQVADTLDRITHFEADLTEFRKVTRM